MDRQKATSVSKWCLFTSAALAAALLPACAKPNEYKAPPPVEVTVSPPVSGAMTDTIETDGIVAATQQVEIRAQIAGLIKQIHFKDGQDVKEGDLLFEIDPREYSAAASQAAAGVVDLEARLSFAKSDFERSEELYTNNSISQQEFEMARQKMKALDAQVVAARAAQAGAAVKLDFTKVKAPIDGRMSRRLVDRGQLVGAGEATLLATIVSSDSTYVEFSFGESELQRVREYFGKDPKIREAYFANPVVRAGLRGEDGFPHLGKLDSFENEIQSSTGSLRLRGIFPSGNGLFPGVSCRVEVPLGTSEGLAVPEAALMLDQVGRYVFVVDEKQQIERKNVKLGVRTGALRRIESGIAATDRVVVRGQVRVRLGTHVTAKEEKVQPPAAPGAPATPSAPAAPSAAAPAAGGSAPTPAPKEPKAP